MLEAVRNIELSYKRENWQDRQTDLNSTLPQSMQAHPSTTLTQPLRQVQTSINTQR